MYQTVVVTTHDAKPYYGTQTGSHGWRCSCGEGGRPLFPLHAAQDAAEGHNRDHHGKTPALPLSEADALRVELDRLRTRVEVLAPIAEAAYYVQGPAGCVSEDRECDEYLDPETDEDRPEVEWCSHVKRRCATRGDALTRERLESLLDDIRLLVDKSTEGDGAKVREALYEGLCSIGTPYEDDSQVDTSCDPYRAVLDEEARTSTPAPSPSRRPM